jgi:GGDEF domain-containing protein
MGFLPATIIRPPIRLLVAAACAAISLLFFASVTHAAVHADTVVLHDAEPVVALNALVDAWLEPTQIATIVDVARASTPFASHRVPQPYSLRNGKTLWIKLRVVRVPGERASWVMDIPIPYLDSVTLYQRDFSGHWNSQVSGDTLAYGSWTQQGLHPAFRVQFADDEPQELILQIRNMSEVGIPIRFSHEGVYENRRASEGLVMGWLLGMLLTLAGFSLVRFIEQRNRLDLGAASYALLVCFTVAQVNGVLNTFLWSELPVIGNYASKFASVVGVGGSLLFMRRLYALSIHFHRFDQLLGVAGWAAIATPLGIVLLDLDIANAVESAVYIASTTVALVAAVLSWREKSPIWHWLLIATVPQALGILWLAAETASLVEPLWQMRYYTSLCAALSVPVLSIALRNVTKERRERMQRANHLSTRDALTGLLNREVFEQHVKDSAKRVRDQNEPVALVIVRLLNYPQIVNRFGSAMGEQCELRAVVKLHRVLRDVDPACRIGAGKFAMLLEGVGQRDQLSNCMVQLIASGLTPQPGLQPPIPLQFHVACAMLHERPVNTATVIDELLTLVAGIAAGTRRPIRFLEPALPVSDVEEAQSVMPDVPI